jgi:hypothetical protein
MARERHVAVIDGNNVAYEEPSRRGNPKLGNIRRMRDALEACGYRPLTIVDATLRHEIDDCEAMEKLLEDGEIRQAPAGTPADFFVLETAEHEGGIVVSNDIYRQWRKEHPWIAHRRVPFMIVDGHVEPYFGNLEPGFRPERPAEP